MQLKCLGLVVRSFQTSAADSAIGSVLKIN